MERIRTEILPGVWLTALRTDKFKTAWLSVNLLTQLRRSTAACTAVLPYVLRRGSTRLPDLETIAAELESLYGASITPSVRKLGEIQAVGFEAEFADDGAVGEEIFPGSRPTWPTSCCTRTRAAACCGPTLSAASARSCSSASAPG